MAEREQIDRSLLSSMLTTMRKLTKRRKIMRSSSAPAMVALSRISGAEPMARHELSSASSIVRQVVIDVVIYLSISMGIYIWKQTEFKGKKTFPVVDGLYFCIVTMCTIGYGDIVPNTPCTKETVLLLGTTDHDSCYEMAKTYIIDVEKGRMRIRIKVALALVVVGACIGVGTLVVRSLERLSWLNSFYVTVTSVTTLGYGDYAFDTLEGWMFASIWLLREMTVGDLMATDINNNGSMQIYDMKEVSKRIKKEKKLENLVIS
jgi:potassium channel subfamily K